jgi:hypothetical protein
MSGPGRLRPVRLLISTTFERPLSGKADVQILVIENSLRNDRYTPDSGQ